VRPILQLLTCPLILLTLGLFTLVINTLMLYVTSYVGDLFGVGLAIDGFLSAFLGAVIISVISLVLTTLVKDTERPRSHAKKPK
jgi:putative membrane protein